MTVWEELKARGLIAQVTDEDEIKEMVNNGKATFYIGFDPTADSLHVGHFMALCLMKRLQMAGNRPIALLGGAEYVQEAFPVKTVDTTGAGDTFCGYFLAAACAHKSPQAALCEASAAAALAVSRAGAVPSIPQADEVRTFLKKRMFLQQIE